MEAAVEKIRLATAEEVMPLLNLAVGDDVQQIGLDVILMGCQFFMLDGLPSQLGFALTKRGSELWVQAAGGYGKYDLTSLILAKTERLAAGKFNSVGFQTRRRGLVKKASALGYKVDGYILRKLL